MRLKTTAAKKNLNSDNFYAEFAKLDGQHPWMESVPNGFVAYRVRQLNSGKIAYFNFVLAKEMGLVDPQHPHNLNDALEKKLIETFSIQIINEYDELTNKRISPNAIRPNKYMATRYLQLQHSNKQGKTSGDGRGIWNGTIQHRGLTWDVSSRGTGVTCLAPGAVEANKPLKTGGTQYGYGCGLAEIDELLGAAILAEIMHLQGIPTERVLCIIDLGKGYGIGVRAAPNLIRPAHLFLYLKQERYKDLKAATDYFLRRQINNKKWPIKAKLTSNAVYDEAAEIICQSFAKFTATLDIDYVFAWLDWDGDNVLADAGIIDYGSVRQFGIRHDKYRYDDVERFSTNLNEQRQKARLMVQVFLQMFDYLKTQKRKPLKVFANHPILQKFNKHFAQYRNERLLYRMGFNQIQRDNILNHKSNVFEKFDKVFSYFERAKVSGAQIRVADGINHPALFNMRNILASLPNYYLSNKTVLQDAHMPEEEFFKIIISSFAKSKDAQLGKKQRIAITLFQSLYKELIEIAAAKGQPENILKGISSRSAILNSEKRITGNALIEIVNQMLAEKKRGLSHDQIQNVVDRFIHDHINLPEAPLSRFYRTEVSDTGGGRPDLYSRLLNLVANHKEDI